jgi:hypothetical protein
VNRRSAWLCLLGLCGAPACNQRFEFDVASAGGGAGGAVSPRGGAPAGGVAASGASAHGGDGGAEVGEGAAPGACGMLGECAASLHCAAGLCSQCAADADCAVYDLSRCEPTRHRCVSCLTSADCVAGFACDSLANHCLQACREDEDCPATAHGCDERRLVCYQCDEDRECATSPLGHLCATDGSGCVECRKETDCPGRHCDQLAGRCVDCRDALDCTSLTCDPTTFSCID